MAGSIGGAMSLISGVTGIFGGASQQNLASQAFAQQDPFGSQRGMYQQQLSKLMSDPSSFLKSPIFTSSLNLGLQSVDRMEAARGNLGSGAEKTALMDYGQSKAMDYLTQQEQILGQFAGAGIAPNQGASLGANANAWGTIGSGLSSLGTGATTLANQAWGQQPLNTSWFGGVNPTGSMSTGSVLTPP